MTPIPAAAMPLPTYEQSEKFEVGVVRGRGSLLWIYVCRRMGCLILLIVLRVQWGLWHSVRIKGRLDQLVNLLYSFLVWNSLSLSLFLSLSLSLFLSFSQLCVYFFFTYPSLVSYQIFPNIFSHFYSLFLLLVVGVPPLLLPSNDPRRSVWCSRWFGSFVGIQDNLCWGWCGKMADKRLKNPCTCKCVACTYHSVQKCMNHFVYFYTLRALGKYFACDDTCLCRIFNGFCYWLLLASNLILVFLISLVNCVCTCVCVCHAIFNLYSLQLFFVFY